MSGPHPDLPHCTRPLRHGLGVLAAILALTCVAPGVAAADGDPASDVLASQALFVPQDAGLTTGQQAELEALLAAGRRAGYDLHVAVIAGAGDLGAVRALWGIPGGYARFLGQEVALVVHGPLLVVMPSGYGYVGAAGASSDDGAAVAGLPAPGAVLGARTIDAVRRLAAAAGHPLPLVSASARAGGDASSAGLAWGVFAAGWLVIAAAWTLSLRARPLSAPAVEDAA